MDFIVLAISGIIFAICCYKGYKLKKYEFENRTDGGVVQFDSFGASVRHNLMERFVWVVGCIAILVFLLEIITWFKLLSY